MVYFAPRGLLILPALKSASPDSLLSSFTIFTALLVAAFASSIEFQKEPLPPAACILALVSNISLYIALTLAIPDSSVIALNIEYLGSVNSPNNFFITSGGAPVFSIISFTNLPPGKSSKVFPT